MMGSLQIRTMEIIDGLMKSVDQNVFLHFPFSFVASMAIKMWSSNSCAFEVTPDTPVFVSVIRTCFMCVKPVNSVNFWHAPDFLFNCCELYTLFMKHWSYAFPRYSTSFSIVKIQWPAILLCKGLTISICDCYSLTSGL